MEKEKLFLRKATGLVRSWSMTDAWIFNVLAVNLLITLAYPLFIAPILQPSGSFLWAYIITGIICIFEAIVYAVLGATLPRSGGMYHFESRILHPMAGHILAINGIAGGQILFLSIAGWYAAAVCLSPLFAIIGHFQGIPLLIDIASWMVTANGLFTVAVITIVWITIVNIIGMKWYARLQRVFFWVAIACTIIAFISLVSSTRGGFIASYNTFANSWGGLPYNQVISKATELGNPPPQPISLGGTIYLIPVAAFNLIYPIAHTVVGGEIKGAESFKKQIFPNIGSIITCTVLGAIMIALVYNTAGFGYINSAAYLANIHPDVWYGSVAPIEPTLGFLLGVSNSNVFFSYIALIALNAWFWMWGPNITLVGSRMFQAAAFDRTLPEKFGEVSGRFMTPVNAIAFFFAAGVILSYFMAFHGFDWIMLGTAMIAIITFAVDSFAAAILPWRKPDLWKASPASKYKSLRWLVPLSAAIFIGFSIFCVQQYLFVNDLGVNNPYSLAFFVCMAIFLAIVFQYYAWKNKKQGIDIGRIYKEIPVE